MYQSMRRHSLAAVLPRLLLALVLAVVLLAFTAGSAFRLMAGPDPLNVLGTQAAAGDYVSVDMSQIVTGYASLTNEKSDGSTNTIKTCNFVSSTHLTTSIREVHVCKHCPRTLSRDNRNKFKTDCKKCYVKSHRKS